MPIEFVFGCPLDIRFPSYKVRLVEDLLELLQGLCEARSTTRRQPSAKTSTSRCNRAMSPSLKASDARLLMARVPISPSGTLITATPSRQTPIPVLES